MRETEARDRLAAMYDEYAPRVYGYAVRHCGPAEADDVVAETFAVAWRRIDVVPEPAIGWLIVTARNVVNGRRRTERKHVDLARLAAESPQPDELLHEAAPGQDRLRAEAARLRPDVLARATARPRRRVRRPVRTGIAAAVVATVGVGGVAYATGSTPTWVADSTRQFGEEAGIPVARQPETVQVIDLVLPDGSRVAAWRAISDEMWCTTVVDQWDGSSFSSGGGSCSDSGPVSYELNRISIRWAEGTGRSTYYPVLWGDAYDDAVEVHVTGRFAGTGEQVDLSLPVDPETGAFAGVLPGTRDRPHLSQAAPRQRDHPGVPGRVRSGGPHRRRPGSLSGQPARRRSVSSRAGLRSGSVPV